MSRRRLQQASSAEGHNQGATYIDAHVLLLTWRGASPQVSAETAALQHCFATKYNFETDTHTLSKPGRTFHTIERFIRKKARPAKLLVIYYNGQSQLSQCDDLLVLFSSLKTPGCDVLFLWDCEQKIPCESSVWSSETTTQGTVWEMLTSDILRAEQQSQANGGSESRSFTATLAEVLSDAAASDSPVSLANLRARLVTMQQSRRQDMPRVVLGSPTYDNKSVSGRSIALSRLPPRDEAQVTLCLRLKNDYDTTQWARWIDNIEDESPARQPLVTISTCRSPPSSPLVLVAVPISKWQSILDSPSPSAAYVGFEIIGGTDAIAHPMSNIIEDHLASRLGTDNPYSTESPIEPPSATTADPSPTRSKRGYSEFEGDAGGEIRSPIEEPKRARKALPTGRKLLPIERGVILSPTSPSDDETVVVSENQRKALPTARTWSLPSITSPLSPNSQVLFCAECNSTDNPNSPSKIWFKDDESLAAHVRKMHTRPFQCVFCWAGCESKFASKNEWKRHVMSQHILLHFWVCQEGACAKIVNVHHKVDERFSHGSIFNRKDLYTQHLRRMHQSAAVKKLHKQAKIAGKQPAGAAVTEFNDWVHDMQIKSQIERCRLPDHMVCPAEGCALDFSGPKAFDDRMEHVAKHLERAALGHEPPVVFGGTSDPTLTEWATKPEVGIAKRRGSNGWQQDNPLKPGGGGGGGEPAESSETVG